MVGIEQTLGVLRTCMDRRFIHGFMDEFEGATGLKEGAYWVATNKGGAVASHRGDRKAEIDYAINHGATQIGWGAHLEVCGGLPGVGDGEISKRLYSAVVRRAEQYPQVNHYGLVASTAGIDVFTPLEARRYLSSSRTTIPLSTRSARR